MKEESDSKIWKKDVKVLTEAYDKILSEISPGMLYRAASKASTAQEGPEKNRLTKKFTTGMEDKLERGIGSKDIIGLRDPKGATINIQPTGARGASKDAVNIAVITPHGHGILSFLQNGSKLVLTGTSMGADISVLAGNRSDAIKLGNIFKTDSRSIPTAAQVQRDSGTASPSSAPETSPGSAPKATEQPGSKGPQGAV